MVESSGRAGRRRSLHGKYVISVIETELITDCYSVLLEEAEALRRAAGAPQPTPTVWNLKQGTRTLNITVYAVHGDELRARGCGGGGSGAPRRARFVFGLCIAAVWKGTLPVPAVH